jgi:NAD(P)H-hydrate epimerase
MTTPITLEMARTLLPPRPDDAHKGVFGHVLVVAGARGFAGAARMAAEGACRAGCGLVTMAVPAPIGDLVAMGLPEAMTVYLPATREGSLHREALLPALNATAGKQVVVLGPGLTQHPETVAFVHTFVAGCPVPAVVDADALNALAKDRVPLVRSAAPRVITPHPGEAARLLRTDTAAIQSDRAAAARQLATETRAVVVLKGAGTIVHDPESDQACINTTGNPALATGGTGDVLAGLIGGLLAQGMRPGDAARLGVYLHGAAADQIARHTSGRGAMARDLLAMLPRAWRVLEEVQ